MCDASILERLSTAESETTIARRIQSAVVPLDYAPRCNITYPPMYSPRSPGTLSSKLMTCDWKKRQTRWRATIVVYYRSGGGLPEAWH